MASWDVKLRMWMQQNSLSYLIHSHEAPSHLLILKDLISSHFNSCKVAVMMLTKMDRNYFAGAALLPSFYNMSLLSVRSALPVQWFFSQAISESPSSKNSGSFAENEYAMLLAFFNYEDLLPDALIISSGWTTVVGLFRLAQQYSILSRGIASTSWYKASAYDLLWGAGEEIIRRPWPRIFFTFIFPPIHVWFQNTNKLIQILAKSNPNAPWKAPVQLQSLLQRLKSPKLPPSWKCHWAPFLSSRSSATSKWQLSLGIHNMRKPSFSDFQSHFLKSNIMIHTVCFIFILIWTVRLPPNWPLPPFYLTSTLATSQLLLIHQHPSSSLCFSSLALTVMCWRSPRWWACVGGMR